MQMDEDQPRVQPAQLNAIPGPSVARPALTPTQGPAAARNAATFARPPNPGLANPPGRTAAPSNPPPTGGGWGFLTSVWDWWFGPSVPAATISIPPPPPTRRPIAAQQNRLTGHNCVSCMDPIRGVEVGTPCGHHYDKTCILGLFEAAIKDESLFPPRCCRLPIPLRSVSSYMSADSVLKFTDKTVEFRTRKRVYCARPSCSRFLGKQYEGELAHIRAPRLECPVPGCGMVTCSSCKSEAKWGLRHRCQADEADAPILALGQQSGWARCPGCETMIELNMGCYHMTCRCRTEFCYLCRARWKTCPCPQWDEQRLLVAAQARADAQIRFGAAQPQVRVHREPAAPAAPRAPVPVRAPPLPAAPARVAPVPAAPQAPARRDLMTAELPGVHPPARASQAATRVPDAAGTIARTHTIRLRQAPAVSASSSATGSTLASRTRPAAVPSASSSSSNWRSSVVRPSGSSRTTAATREQTEVEPSKKRERQDLVQQWVERLRVNHDCNHDAWKYRRGEGSCEVCHDHLRLYLFRCNGCELMACRRCRWNRL
ncbi:hypothetical protein K466DRAFT_550427 [Polyporus arcularius HHB13444]|uniref:RBR-type E3 ubiquitin transferase n=1 Tax=Polyporus arcularius HHB13444 TaxID=1314778 RepID=A0A5C3PKB8_9APHY|nr:hypothetical protein K466DRAFT_550427 [Polyporus arcularius HHB13444]